MRESFRNFRGRLSLLLLATNVIVALMVGLGALYLSDVVDLGERQAMLLALAFGIVIALALAFVEERVVSRPFNILLQAMLHVSSEESSTMPPSVVAAQSRDPFIKTMVESIFRLASASYDITSDIEDRRVILEKALNGMPIAVLLFDAEGGFVYGNKVGDQIIDYDDNQAVGEPLEKLLDLHYQTDETIQSWLEVCRKNKFREDKFWERVSLLRQDNSKNIYDVIAHYDKGDEHGIELIVALVDRTNEYMVDESELDFVALAAHELRSPITVIRGYLDVFDDELKETFTVEQRALLQKMTVSAEMLSGYVNNILNVARVDQGHIKLHIRKADWGSIVKAAHEDLTLRAQVHGRKLRLEMPDKMPEVAVDRVSITEVINNLVDNAIKYSREGDEVLIKVTSDDNQISTEVIDHGVGIPEPVVGNLFKKFYRSHRTRQGVTGTGLGLYLTKVIIDSHGGNIWVRSKEGKGSTFGFELPTYDTIADTLKAGNNDGEGIRRSSHGWIKNHSLNRR